MKYTKIRLSLDVVKLLLEGLRIGGLGIDERVCERTQLYVTLRDAYAAFNPTKHEGICVEVTESHQMILAKAEAQARRARNQK